MKKNTIQIIALIAATIAFLIATTFLVIAIKLSFFPS